MDYDKIGSIYGLKMTYVICLSLLIHLVTQNNGSHKFFNLPCVGRMWVVEWGEDFGFGLVRIGLLWVRK